MNNKKFQIHWPRVLFFVLLFCIIAIVIYSIYFYRYIENSKLAGVEEAESFILDKIEVSELGDPSYFQGEEGYFIFSAKNDKSKPVYIFLRDDDSFSSKHLFVLEKDKFLSTGEIEGLLMKDCDNCQLIGSTPAMIDKIPLLEVTYIDERDRYVLEYRYLESGKTFETLRLTRKYKKG